MTNAAMYNHTRPSFSHPDVIAERDRLIAQGRIDLLVDGARRMTLDQGEALIAAIEGHWPNHKSEYLDEIKAMFSENDDILTSYGPGDEIPGSRPYSAKYWR